MNHMPVNFSELSACRAAVRSVVMYQGLVCLWVLGVLFFASLKLYQQAGSLH